MKKPILLIVLLFVVVVSRAQIFLEKPYTSSTTLTELAVSGYKYYLVNKAFPNPATSLVTIPYQLPEGVDHAEIRLTNGIGQVMKSYKVDRTFRELKVQTADLPKGVYTYQLKTDQGIISTGKLVHD